MIVFAYLVGVIVTWVVAAVILERDDPNLVFSVLIGFLMSLLWPITLVGLGVAYLVHRLVPA